MSDPCYRCALALSTLIGLVPLQSAEGQCFGTPTPVPIGTIPRESAWFGYSVSMRGDLAVIGQPFAIPNQAAHAYAWNGASWEFVSTLIDPGPIAGFTGTAVDTDGERVIVGSGFGINGASAVIYRRENGVFIFEARLTPPGQGANGSYGQAVAIDGDLAALGRDSQQGGVDVYKRVGGVWQILQSLQSNTPLEPTEFGDAVGLSAEHLVVGSPEDTFVTDIGPVGAVYIYTRDASGVTFQQRVTSAAMPFRMGRSVAIDGSTIVAGSGGASGSIEDSFVFVLADGQWGQQAVLPARDAVEFDDFGGSVAISGDFIAIGAKNDDALGASSGAVFMYRRNGTTWTPFLDVLAPGGAAGDQFGHGVALDAGRLLVGAPTHDHDMLGDPGSAFSFISATAGGSLLPIDQSVPLGAGAEIAANASGVPPFTYQWSIGGVPVPAGLPPYSGADTGTLTVESASMTLADSITVDVADGCGFITTLGPASVHVTPPTATCPGDANGDGSVLFNDITSVLTNFGVVCP